MRYIIYQIKKDKDVSYQFMGWNYAKDKLNYDDYKRVYHGILEDNPVHDDIDILEYLYRKFNNAHPSDFKGYSLSVSDVVILYDDDRCGYYYCDSIGWKDITDIINERK